MNTESPRSHSSGLAVQILETSVPLEPTSQEGYTVFYSPVLAEIMARLCANPAPAFPGL